MARNMARLKMGFYPLPIREAARLRALLDFTGPASVVDPCVGQGTALEIVTHGADVRRFGVELDAERALIAQSKGIETIQGNAFDAIAKPESFSLLYLNPPYDSEIGLVANNRMERLFLDHTYRWLVMDGVLAMIIPFERLMDCAGLLSSHFTHLNLFRMTDSESERFRQIAVLGVRSNVRGAAVDANKRHLQRIGLYGSYQELPELAPDVCEPYRVPPSGETALSYRGLPYDLLEDLLPHSSAWKQVMPFLAPHEDVATGRPITPLHGGHVGLLCTAGLLNGVFGQGDDRHIARWRSVKHVTTFVEHDEETNGVVLRYNPAFVDTLNAATLAGVLAHEVMHPALQHHTRRAKRDPRRWNEACDYAINPLLLDAGLSLPDDVLVDPCWIDAYRTVASFPSP